MLDKARKLNKKMTYWLKYYNGGFSAVIAQLTTPISELL